MNKNYALLIIPIILFLIPPASAEVELINNLKDTYNLGDKITTNFSISESIPIQGIFKISLICENYNLDYFTNVVNLKKEEIKKFNSELPVTDSMLGRCYISSILEDMDHNLIDSFKSKEFLISDELKTSINKNKENFFPSEILSIYFNIEPTYSEDVVKDIIIKLSNKTYKFRTNKTNFKYDIKIPSDIKSGKNILSFRINDSFGNSFGDGFFINITPIAKKLSLDLNKHALIPQEEIKIKPILYDQAGDLLVRKINLTILKDKKILINKEVNSGEFFTYIPPPLTAPGSYKVKVKYEKLSNEKDFYVKGIKKLKIEIISNTILIENIGNIPYNDFIKFNLSNSKKYCISYKIKLNPGEKTIVDLSKLVEAGNYSIVIYENSNKIISQGNMFLEDNRPFHRKLFQNLLSITGGSALLTYPNTKANIIFIVLTLIVVISVFLFYKKLKKRKI